MPPVWGHFSGQYIAVEIIFRFEFAISGMEMRRVMLAILLEVHGNQNAIEKTDGWHGAGSFLSCFSIPHFCW